MAALDLISSWPVDSVSAGWIDTRSRRKAAGDAGAVYRLASITKPLFAYAVLVAIEEGTLSLDQPAGPEGSTIRHLLAHASGLGDDPDGSLMGVRRRRIYSNGAYEVLGRELEAASAMSAAEYLRLAVVEPLGLTSTSLEGSPAHGAVSSVDDLLLVAAEWLRPTLISPITMTEATQPQFPELRGVLPGFGAQDPNPWGLGFELKGPKDPHWTGSSTTGATFGHFGRAGTLLWVDPERGVACVALTDREFGSWAVPLWNELADAVVAEAAQV